MKNKKAIFWGVLTIAWLCVIYSFSLEPADLSEDTSLGLIGWLVEYVIPWLKDDIARLSEAQMLMLHGLVRKAAHFTEYFILGVLSGNTVWQADMNIFIQCGQKAIQRQFDIERAKREKPCNRCDKQGRHDKIHAIPRVLQGLAAFVFCVIAASLDETIQLFVEGRAGMVRDVVLDSFGAAAGIGTVLFIIKGHKKNRGNAG